MATLANPLIGVGASEMEFPINRNTRSLLIKTSNTSHKVQFLEIDKITGLDAILGIQFLESFDECTFTFYPEKRLLLEIKGAQTMVLPLYTKTSESHTVKRGDSTEELTDTALNPKKNQCKCEYINTERRDTQIESYLEEIRMHNAQLNKNKKKI